MKMNHPQAPKKQTQFKPNQTQSRNNTTAGWAKYVLDWTFNLSLILSAQPEPWHRQAYYFRAGCL